jgi:hydrogenase maturation protease
MNTKPVAIIGVGNYLMSDEGVGIHAIKFLENLEWPDDIELIDGGTPGVALMYLLENRKLVIILDCADFNANPGEIGVFDPNDLIRDENSEISLHATDLLSSLELAKKLGSYPDDIVIVGIQPSSIEMGTKLSLEAEKALEDLRPAIDEILRTKQPF